MSHTRAEIGDHIDLSTRKVSDLFKGNPELREASLDEIRIFYIRDLREKAAGRYSKGSLDLSQERAHLARAQRIKCELETDVLRKNLLPREQVVNEFGEAVTRYRAKMLALPVKAAAVVSGLDSVPEVESIIKNLVHEALEELVGIAAGDGSDIQQGEATAGTAYQPMGGQPTKAKPRSKRRARPMEH